MPNTFYAMFTDEGNAAVDDIVARAKAGRWDWEDTLVALEELAKDERFGEALDTDVREHVYDTLGFTSPFYV